MSYTDISIHTALAGCDGDIVFDGYNDFAFQSTQPSQAVTLETILRDDAFKFQSTQPSQAVTAIIPKITYI